MWIFKLFGIALFIYLLLETIKNKWLLHNIHSIIKVTTVYMLLDFWKEMNNLSIKDSLN